MKKTLIMLIPIITILGALLTACGPKYMYEVCPAESGIIGPCNDQVLTISLSEGKPTGTFSVGTEFPNILVSVQGQGWIYLNCSPKVSTKEDAFGTTFSAVNSTEETGSCTISTKIWPKYDDHIQVKVVFYGQ